MLVKRCQNELSKMGRNNLVYYLLNSNSYGYLSKIHLFIWKFLQIVEIQKYIANNILMRDYKIPLRNAKFDCQVERRISVMCNVLHRKNIG